MSTLLGVQPKSISEAARKETKRIIKIQNFGKGSGVEEFKAQSLKFKVESLKSDPYNH